MNKVFLKVAAAALALAAAGYGAYKLYQKYCGAKIAKQNKFRNRVADMSYNFDDDEYLEDDDVYYFGQSVEYAEEDTSPAMEVVTDETEQTSEKAPAQSIEDATIDELLGSSAE